SSFKITIDGSELDVCGKCSQYGTLTKKRTPVSRKDTPVVPRTPAKTSRPRKTGFEGLDYEFIDGYDQIIRDARQSRGWTQEELAAKMKEKVSLIKKIERGEIVPEDSVRVKLERTLDIKLTERVGESDWSGERLNKGTTLGDIVTIKRK
ncbi:MAG: TIGR00270 family protein, partial [Methanosarcinaceae archaeon]|nr:TIGR00270 family protein [Methanosarcinaceae archaeon]